MRETIAIIVAAGRGSRAVRPGAAVTDKNLPKQYTSLADGTVLSHTLCAYLASPHIDRVITVIHADDADLYDQSRQLALDRTPPDLSIKLQDPVTGGATRQISVRHGLERAAALAAGDAVALIHDAARPFIPGSVIARVIAAVDTGRGAIAALPVVDTLKRASDSNGVIGDTVDRTGLWRAQTPQGFRLTEILDAHRLAAAQGRADLTDDAAVAEAAGLVTTVVQGADDNFKLTTPEDLERARALMLLSRETRTGTGFDVHKFGPGNSVWLCGIEIPHDQALVGHSDADVGLHALTDALLGAIGDGDIGQHFPPSDPQWKGARSDRFLADAGRRVRERGGQITNVDVTLLCEAPKVGPHREAMRSAIANILGIEIGRVGVKATTTEQLGFTGRREGIAAMAAATVTLPA